MGKYKHGLTKSEYIIAKAPVEVIVNEFNLITQKKSRLPSHLRYVVKKRVEYLINAGVIIDQNLKHEKK